MSTRALLILRISLMLLAVFNLAILGVRLWPWQDVPNLPGNGAAGIDPAICLLGYIGLIFWIASVRREPMRSALFSGAMLGLAGGLPLAAQVMLKAMPAAINTFHPVLVSLCLLLTAGVVWGIAGWRGSRIAGSVGVGMFSAIWSAMVSCLIACAAVLMEMYLAAGPVPEAQDAWSQYEGLAIGTQATQTLLHSLSAICWFLLVGPLVGGALGLAFGFFGQPQKD